MNSITLPFQLDHFFNQQSFKNTLKRPYQNIFLDQVKNIIKENIDDESFGVQSLSEALQLSRTQVYRKVLSHSSYSPVILIKIIRLDEAARILRENNFNVTEVTYKVGFSNPAYFIKNFKKRFGLTPKQYQLRYFYIMIESAR